MIFHFLDWMFYHYKCCYTTAMFCATCHATPWRDKLQETLPNVNNIHYNGRKRCETSCRNRCWDYNWVSLKTVTLSAQLHATLQLIFQSLRRVTTKQSFTRGPVFSARLHGTWIRHYNNNNNNNNNNNSLLISLSQPKGWITRMVSDNNTHTIQRQSNR